MIFYSLHKKENLSNIEFNHRLFCKLAHLEFNKEMISDSVAEKYTLILDKLQKNFGKVVVFADSDTYFKKYTQLPELDRDIYIQKIGDIVIDTFLVVKSNEKTVKIFEDLCDSINKQAFTKEFWRDVKIEIPEEHISKYPLSFSNGDYFNLCLMVNSEGIDMGNVFAVNTYDVNSYSTNSKYFANSVCEKKFSSREENEEPYECFNEGKENALVCLYTPEIKMVGMVAEENLKLYCKKNDITLHMYRDVTKELKEQNISGAWCKPWLLLENFDKHKSVAWIDSDILIAKDYKINFEDDITCFKDPWFPMNSGFMVFKTNEKNRQVLNDVIDEFKKIEGTLEGVYNHGGDQPVFTRKIKEHYPEYSFRSTSSGNSHPAYPEHISPERDDVMIHFMGYAQKYRYHIMDGFAQIINKRMR